MVELKIGGKRGCFTSEDKGERYSYPVITPSAARGILQSIFWKPEFEYEVINIKVLNPIKYFSIRTNEVKNKYSPGKEYINVVKSRTQRQTVGLRNLSYIISAEVNVPNDSYDLVSKYQDQFRRRVSRGSCWTRPYLGMIQYFAYFGDVTGDEVPIKNSMDLGKMLFDWDYTDLSHPKPIFFDAKMVNGVVEVPSNLYPRNTKGG